MTAIRVVTDHAELENSGAISHSTLDNYIVATPWLVVSGAAGPIPSSSRYLKAGNGISIVDSGTAGALTITSTTNIVWNEIPSGSNNGVNLNFVLANTPSPTTALMLFVNGLKQREGAGSDFVLSGSTISLNYAIRSGSNIDATYYY